MPTHKLVGSERDPMPGARSVGKTDPNERLEVSVRIRRPAGEQFHSRLSNIIGGGKSAAHMTREEYANNFAAQDSDIAAVKKYAAAHQLAVVQESAERRTVKLSGTVAQFNAAFGVDLQTFEYDGGSYRGRTGPVTLPAELKDIVEGVFGLDNRPQAKPHFRARRAQGNVNWHASPGGPTTFTPPQLATLYNFPDGTGTGEAVALIELGGGYRPSDLKTYFSKIGVKPAPQVIAVSVDHAGNSPTGDPNGPDGEVMLDIEVVGGVAPGAKVVVYFAPNTDAGFLDAITTAIHDNKNNPSVISISWGSAESGWTSQAMDQFDQAFQTAAAMGITVCVASGDNGSSDGVGDGGDHVDFPASSPNVLGCGGTNIHTNGSTITAEGVWNDGGNGGAGGGGVSEHFALPSWQQGLKVVKNGSKSALTNRGVPDVSGDADPETGYYVRVDGKYMPIGGTSAVAPLWAGLIARINGASGKKAGFVNAHLYANPSAMNDVTQGNNGDFSASPGWDACTGLGSPNGKKVSGVI